MSRFHALSLTIAPKSCYDGIPFDTQEAIREIIRCSPITQCFGINQTSPRAYNALLQNIGTVNWVFALRFFSETSRRKKSHVDDLYRAKSAPLWSPNVETARVNLNILFKSSSWQLVTRHFTQYCFARFSPSEAMMYGLRLHVHLRQHASPEIAMKVLEMMRKSNLPFTDGIEKHLFQNNPLSWSMHLWVLSILYQKNRKLVSSKIVHRALFLCNRDMHWKSCVHLFLLAKNLNIRVKDTVLLKSALLLFKENRWFLSTMILEKHRVPGREIQNDCESAVLSNSTSRMSYVHMFALARMWQDALRLITTESIEKVTHVLRLSRAWEFAIHLSHKLITHKVCNETETIGIEWPVVENIVHAGLYDKGSHKFLCKLLRLFSKISTIHSGFWKLALKIRNANHAAIIEHLPLEMRFLDMQFFPVFFRTHACLRFKIFFPLVLEYLSETRLITPEERSNFMRLYYPTRFQKWRASKDTRQRWCFAFDMLNLVASCQDKVPLQRATFNQVIVTVSHLTDVPYLTMIKGHIDHMKLKRLPNVMNTDSTLKSFAYGGHLTYIFSFLKDLFDRSEPLSIDSVIFLISNLALPGASATEVTSIPQQSQNVLIKVSSQRDAKIFFDFIKMYEFADLIRIESSESHILERSTAFPFIISASLASTSIRSLQWRIPKKVTSVLAVMEERSWALFLKPPHLESISHNAALRSKNECSDLTSVVLHKFPNNAAVRSFGLTHRLDLQTSGLLLIAKSQCAYHHITQQSLTKLKRKSYLCLCIQIDPLVCVPRRGTIQTPFSGMRDSSHRMTLEGEDDAATRYTIHKTLGHTIHLIECRLITGKQHQIRVHMKKLGLYLLGDDRYGCGLASCPLLHRVALHAKEIGFRDPTDNKIHLIETTLPDDMKMAYERLLSVLEEN